ncbi:MAG: sigma-70 family RNA polymerase sigma factor [Pseudomonadales bacterium]|nr:sigma-70 family RNA polymerase sigma factor [Pseudomonadales bacterium]
MATVTLKRRLTNPFRAMVMTEQHKSEATPDLRADERYDDGLLVAWQNGRAQAFDELYDRHSQALFSYLYRNCRHEAQANEMFQDVWVRVISSAASYQHRGRFRSWLFTLAHNRLVDYYRRAEHQYQTESADDLGGTDVPPEQQAEQAEERQQLQDSLDTLPPEQRQAFYLREECGFSIADIAVIQGITAEAAKSRLRYAYQKLRDQLNRRTMP